MKIGITIKKDVLTIEKDVYAIADGCYQIVFDNGGLATYLYL